MKSDIVLGVLGLLAFGGWCLQCGAWSRDENARAEAEYEDSQS